MNHMDLLISVALGIGLAAATGFRVFVPLLVLALAAWTGHVHLAESFTWLGTPPAIAMLGVAAVAEVSAYYVPGVDHLLDVIAAPAALLAGTIAAAAVITDLPPLVKWTTAVIAGGGAAGLTQGMTTLLRAKSAIATGGLGNPLVASGELGGALGISLLAISMPFVAVALVVLFAWVVVRRVSRLLARRAAAPRSGPT
jgi:hypothetical protein